MGKVNIYTCYNPATDTMTISLPGTDLIADRKGCILTIVDEVAEGEYVKHTRCLDGVMFSDVVNMMVNKVKEYRNESGYGA